MCTSARELREHRRLVAGAGADVEHPLAGAAARAARRSARPCTAARSSGRARSAAPRRRRPPAQLASGTNSSRGTRSIAASTRSSTMPRRRSWRSTISRRPARAVRPTSARRARVGRQLHAEMGEHGRRDVGDARRQPAVEPDGQHRHLERVARHERAVAAAAAWWRPPRSASSQPAGGETSSSPAFGFASAAPGAARARPAGRGSRGRRSSARRRRRAEAELLAVAPRDGLAALAVEHDRRPPSVPSSRRASSAASTRAAGQQVDLAGAVRRRDDDLPSTPAKVASSATCAARPSSGRGRSGAITA